MQKTKMIVLFLLVSGIFALNTDSSFARKTFRQNTNNVRTNTAGSGTTKLQNKETTKLQTTGTRKQQLQEKNISSSDRKNSVQADPAKIPHPSEQQNANIAKLKSDLISIKNNSEITPEMKNKFAQNLKTLAEGTVKPSQESVNNLADNLSSALSDKNLTNKEKTLLINDIYAVMNSANIPPEEVKAVIDDARELLVASNVDNDDVLLVVNDLQAIADELKKNLEK